MSFAWSLHNFDTSFQFHGDLTFQIILDAKAIFGSVRDCGAETVTLDLGRVKRCDSFGLDMIRALQHRARKSGQRCVVANASASVVDLARLARLDQVLSADN
ncbi:MAG: STAS domain-containing protein [Azospirillaceae bacterium]|nr:STAS domain-containing protein [Azospirillaceae bacterium]